MSCNLTLSLPSVTKTEFLLTTSIQYRAVKWRNKEENSIRDYKLIQCQILQIDIMSILWQMLGRIANEILRLKVGGGEFCFWVNFTMLFWSLRLSWPVNHPEMSQFSAFPLGFWMLPHVWITGFFSANA